MPKKANRGYSEEQYYKDLFEHRRQVNDLYNQPLVSGKMFLVFLFLFALFLFAFHKGWIS